MAAPARGVHRRETPGVAVVVTLGIPNTTLTFGPLRMDAVEQLTGKSIESWLAPVLQSSSVTGDGQRRQYVLQFVDGEGFEIPGLMAVRNEGGALKMAVPLQHATTVGPYLGVEGRIVGSRAEYTLPTDGQKAIEFPTPLGAVSICASKGSVRVRSA